MAAKTLVRQVPRTQDALDLRLRFSFHCAFDHHYEVSIEAQRLEKMQRRIVGHKCAGLKNQIFELPIGLESGSGSACKRLWIAPSHRNVLSA